MNILQRVLGNVLNHIEVVFHPENPLSKLIVLLASLGLGARIYIYTSRPAVIYRDQKDILAAVSKDGLALEYASDDLKKDREVVLAAVSQDGKALQYASDERRRDRKVVLAAVSQNGSALQCASDELKKDREVVLAAVSQQGSGFRVCLR